MQGTTGQRSDLVHVFLDDTGKISVDLVGGFAALEVDIGVLSSHLGVGSLRTQSAVAETLDVFHIDQRLHVSIVEEFDLLVLVRGTESVEESKEGNFAFQSGEVSHQSQVVSFLDGGGGGHGITGGTASHNVGVIAEDGERLGGKRTGGNMEDGREHFTGDLVHVGDHQQQTLAGGIGDGQGTGTQ